jgi:hypothetical protein
VRYHNAVVRRPIVVIMACLLSIGFAAGYHADYSMAAEPTDNTGAGELATDVLGTLTVKGRAPKTGYKRTQFGEAWKDVDHNGCDTRNDILNRDLTDVKHKGRTHDCVVKSGKLQDPYTGKEIKFKKGAKTSTAVQIDHVVSLSDAWQKGAQKLSKDERTELANDPYNLLAVDGSANQKKSDGDAATWLPSNKSFRCEYVARQIGVKHKYALWVTQAEKEAMNKVLGSCPTQTVPDYTGTSTGEQSQTATAEPTQEPSSEPTQTEQAPTEPQTQTEQPAPAPQVQQNDGSSVYYQNCSAARAAGAAPIYQGQPGYRSALDRDHDGVACE